MSIYKNKLADIKRTGIIRYMDLFAGCGGLSLGFQAAGFTPVAFVEIDKYAAASHALNIASCCTGGDACARDITQTSAAELLGKHGPVDGQVDILVGGPPCQAFARVGRAKLREQAGRKGASSSNGAHLIDERVGLWKYYVDFVRATKPVGLLMENVPDILNHGGTNIAETIADALEEEGYVVRYALVNAAWYGVPQTRERMILVAYHRDTGIVPVFPLPTHHVDLPKGYAQTRITARKVISREGSWRHVIVPDPDPLLPAATTVQDAFADLPPIAALDQFNAGKLSRGPRNPQEPCGYSTDTPGSDWSRLMRNWPGMKCGQTTGHVFRFLPRDYKIFAMLENGWEYPKIHAHIERFIEEWLAARGEKGLPVDCSAPEVAKFLKEWRIPYDPGKFPNKWWVLEAGKPSRTLLAHLGKDSYSHIHHDRTQARTISIREAARLQGFPDGFRFSGGMNQAFRQIGNAVPPVLALAMASAMKMTLGLPAGNDPRIALLGISPDAIRTNLPA